MPLGMSQTRISEMGIKIAVLLELNSIPQEDIKNIKAYFDAIAEIISRV